MREILQDETAKVSGGHDCLSYDTWQKIQSKARKDGATMGVLASIGMAAISGGAVSAGVIGAPIAIPATLVAFPIAGYWGFSQSSAWNLFSK